MAGPKTISFVLPEACIHLGFQSYNGDWGEFVQFSNERIQGKINPIPRIGHPDHFIYPIFTCIADPGVLQQSLERSYNQRVAQYYAPPDGQYELAPVKTKTFEGKLLKFRFTAGDEPNKIEEVLEEQAEMFVELVKKEKPERIVIYPTINRSALENIGHDLLAARIKEALAEEGFVAGKEIQFIHVEAGKRSGNSIHETIYVPKLKELPYNGHFAARFKLTISQGDKVLAETSNCMGSLYSTDDLGNIFEALYSGETLKVVEKTPADQLTLGLTVLIPDIIDKHIAEETLRRNHKASRFIEQFGDRVQIKFVTTSEPILEGNNGAACKQKAAELK